VNTFYLHPSDVSLPKAAPEALKGGDAAENARIARDVLSGARGPARDIVLFNSAASLLIAGAAADLRDGIRAAEASLDAGRAREVLDRLIRASQASPEAVVS
jgi:anthranilate phosphoribosyltransferase